MYTLRGHIRYHHRTVNAFERPIDAQELNGLHGSPDGRFVHGRVPGQQTWRHLAHDRSAAECSWAAKGGSSGLWTVKAVVRRQMVAVAEDMAAADGVVVKWLAAA